jgi:hypothetical protein
MDGRTTQLEAGGLSASHNETQTGSPSAVSTSGLHRLCRRRLQSFVLCLCAALPASAQLATEQRLLDFQQLGAMFSKRHAFTEWKRATLNWDSLNLAPWLARVNQSKNDLEFFEICAEYVA